MKRIILGILPGGMGVTGVASIPPDVRSVLPLAEKNEAGLTALLNNYEEAGEEERFRAACFLLKNAALHVRHFRPTPCVPQLKRPAQTADSIYYVQTGTPTENGSNDSKKQQDTNAQDALLEMATETDSHARLFELDKKKANEFYSKYN